MVRATHDPNRRIFVAGDRGMVGSALVRELVSHGATNIITASRSDLDLTRQADVHAFFAAHKIDEVYLAAGKVGGIVANNTYPATFIYENILIATNVIDAAHRAGIQKLLFLGSSCIYPRLVPEAIREDALLSNYLEPTNEPYAIAKIAGIKLCESYNRQFGRDYRSVMPTNLFGPNDNFSESNGHVVPALLYRFHNAVRMGAQEVTIWGSGNPRREFLYVEDAAAACVHVMTMDRNVYESGTQPMRSHINIGSGVDCSIRELAAMIATIVGFRGRLVFDATKPDGAPRKLLDVSLLTRLGWKSKISLEDGLRATYQWLLANERNLRC